MTIGFSVSFNDPSATYSPYYALLTSNVLAAAERWGEHLIGDATLEIEVNFNDGNGSGRAGGTSVTTVFTGTQDGLNVWQMGAAAEVASGSDPNGASPDIWIGIAPNYLINELWLDPDPFDRTVAGPADRTDAVSVFIHEIGHALGFNGWRDYASGQLPGDYESTFDSHMVSQGGYFYFDGPETIAEYGGLVPLTFGNPYHYGNDPSEPGSDLVASGLMNGIVYYRGFLYDVAPLDIAILKDLGVPINDFVGYRDDDSIAGDGGDNLLKGLEGNDWLEGAVGNDTVLGGTGNDWLHGNQDNDSVAGSDGSDTVMGGKGNDWVSGDGGADLVRGGENNDSLMGGDGNDTLLSGKGDDLLAGGAGDDRLDSRLGNDTLTGGTGDDVFLFASPLNSTTNVDTVTDFTSGEDEIRLDPGVFAALAGSAGNHVGLSTNLLYDSGTGLLSYDTDGAGSGLAVAFANVGTGLSFSATDFFVGL